MKFKRLLLAFLAMGAFAPGAWAELPTDGEYLIQNVETGCYLGGGNSYGTQSSLLASPQWFALTSSGNGSYTLNSHQNRDGNTYLGTNLYCDSGSAVWTITEQGNGIFTIFNTSGYLSGNGTGDALVQVTEAGASAQWRILDRAALISGMYSATSENPVDVTGLIAGASIRQYSKSTYSSSWTVTGYDGTGTPSNYTYGSNNYSSVSESWHSSNGFDVNQTLKRLPAGNYSLSAQAFTQSGTAAILYANNESVSFPTGTESNLDAARSAFQEGSHPTDAVNFSLQLGEDLKVGVKSDATNNWNAWGEFSLIYKGGANLEDSKSVLNSLVESAKNLLKSAMSADSKTKLQASIANATGDLTAKTEQELEELYWDLLDNKEAAELSIEVYKSIVAYADEVKTKAEKLDAEGQDAYTEPSAAVNANVSAGTYKTLDDYKAAIDPVYVSAVKAQGVGGIMTDALSNPDFTTSDLSGWTITGENPKVDTTNHNCEFYQKTFDMSQTVTGLKKGTYEISFQAFQRLGYVDTANNLLKAYKEGTWTSAATLYTTAEQSEVKNIFADASTTRIYYDANSTWNTDHTGVYNDTTYYIPNCMAGARNWFDATNSEGNPYYKTTAKAVVLENGGSLTFGFKGALGSSGGWLIFDNFTLTYIESEPMVEESASETLIEKAKGLSTVYEVKYEASLNEAISALEANKTSATLYNALNDVVNNVETSISAYKNAAEKLEAMAEIVKSTNLYTAEALETYYTTPKSKYDERTLTVEEANALENPYVNSGKGSKLAQFLMSAWDEVASDNASYWVNQWSTEGDNDGSNFVKPFCEYWTGDANSLGEKVLKAILTGLKANQTYQVSSWTRVRVKNEETVAPYGITLQVGENTPVNVCSGAQVGTSQLYLGNFIAYGTADAEGTLTIKYNIAADNNVSWMAFKNVNYAEVADADAVSTLQNTISSLVSSYEGNVGFETGEYAPYNNIDVLATLNKVKKTLNSEFVSVTELADAQTLVENATLVANTEEVNAIYDPTFTIAGSGAAPIGWTMTEGKTLGGGNNSRAYVKSPNLVEFNEANSVFFIRFDGNYGNPGGADMEYYYGKTEGYTLPLKANTVYALEFDVKNWGFSTRNPIKVDVNDSENSAIASVVTYTEAVDADKEESAPLHVTTWFKTTSAGDYSFTLKCGTFNCNFVVSNFNLKKYTFENETRATAIDKFGTICLPYAFKAEGANVYSVSEIKDNYVVLTQVEGEAEAGKAYIYQATENAQTFSLGEGTVVNAPEAGDLTGVFVETTAPADTYVLQTQNDAQKFYLVAEGEEPTIKPYHAYLNVPEAETETTEEASASYRIVFRGEATAISAVEALTNGKAEIYDLNGRKQSQLRKGINIVNGVKVLVK